MCLEARAGAYPWVWGGAAACAPPRRLAPRPATHPAAAFPSSRRCCRSWCGTRRRAGRLPAARAAPGGAGGRGRKLRARSRYGVRFQAVPPAAPRGAGGPSLPGHGSPTGCLRQPPSLPGPTHLAQGIDPLCGGDAGAAKLGGGGGCHGRCHLVAQQVRPQRLALAILSGRGGAARGGRGRGGGLLAGKRRERGSGSAHGARRPPRPAPPLPNQLLGPPWPNASPSPEERGRGGSGTRRGRRVRLVHVPQRRGRGRAGRRQGRRGGDWLGRRGAAAFECSRGTPLVLTCLSPCRLAHASCGPARPPPPHPAGPPRCHGVGNGGGRLAPGANPP